LFFLTQSVRVKWRRVMTMMSYNVTSTHVYKSSDVR